VFESCDLRPYIFEAGVLARHSVVDLVHCSVVCGSNGRRLFIRA
jgi:hypothetical protein